jgi:hypothetical protein
MAWVAVPGTDSEWEYNNSPSDPGGALTKMWELQTAGIRTIGLSTVYTNCRRTGTTEDVGELSKTYWDARI